MNPIWVQRNVNLIETVLDVYTVRLGPKVDSIWKKLIIAIKCFITTFKSGTVGLTLYCQNNCRSNIKMWLIVTKL